MSAANANLKGASRPRTFKDEHLQQIAFPMGGLGAGCLHLGGVGNFQDFCLFNEPAFGHSPMTFAGLYCREGRGRSGTFRVLEGPVQTPRIFAQGRYGNGSLGSGHEGLPRMQRATFRGEFPFAWVGLTDRQLPLGITMEAYSPFVPRDDLASGLPAAFITYRLRNRSTRRLRIQFSFNVQYPVALGDVLPQVVHRNRGETRGLFFDNCVDDDDSKKATVCVVSPLAGQQANCAWFRGGWFDALTMLTNSLSEGSLKRAVMPQGDYTGRSRFGATLFWNLELRGGDTVDIPLIYCWHTPNSDMRFGPETAVGGDEDCTPDGSFHPYYTTRFVDAWDVARYVLRERESLLRRTRRFHRVLFASSLPSYVLDAVSANLAILKSPTVLRQQDGMLWNWEGCSYDRGCCAGSCTHVWNYAQALPYLFPALERTLRDQELVWSMDGEGHVAFRSSLPTGRAAHDFHAASDGQLGGIMKLYRDWQIAGDDKWLAERYVLARRSMNYCIRTWDPDERGALVEPHHNTYDIEFWGPDSMCTSFYIGALLAMVQMARRLGECADEVRYQALADAGRRLCDDELWNGAYYQQKVEWEGLRASGDLEAWTGSEGRINDAEYSPEALRILQAEGPKYQYGAGCLSDGVIGQWFTTMLGLPDALNHTRARRHLRAVFKYNFRRSLREHANPQRPGYALNDEPGLVLCSWPRGGKPSLPFAYSDEVWTGIEYQVASHMIYEGLVEEGLTIVKAVRQRYDGKVRNPWNEYECGSYYARALASYAVLLALSGFRYSAPDAALVIAPKLEEQNRGRFLFSVQSGWGTVHYDMGKRPATLRIVVEEGELLVREVRVGGPLAPSGLGASFEAPRRATPDNALRIALNASN